MPDGHLFADEAMGDRRAVRAARYYEPYASVCTLRVEMERYAGPERRQHPG